MSTVVPFPTNRRQPVKINLSCLQALTQQVLREIFHDDLNALLIDFTEFCRIRNVRANRYVHYEWACAHLQITEVKAISIRQR